MTLGQHHDTSSDHKQSLREVIDSCYSIRKIWTVCILGKDMNCFPRDHRNEFTFDVISG